MPWKTGEPEWVPDEYPKMLTKEGRPVIYPEGHARQGEHVIFNSADEEKAYSKPVAAKVAVKAKDK